MEVVELVFLERKLWVSSVVMNLHGFDVRGGNLAVRALVLPSAAVSQRRIHLRRYLLSRVLLRLRFSCHDDVCLEL